MSDSIQQHLTTDVARDVVAQVAPQELPLFRSISSEYLKDPTSVTDKRSGRDEMLGFGLGDAAPFLTPVILYVVTEVIKFLTEEVKKSLRKASSELIEEVVRGLFKKFNSPGKKTKQTTSLSPEQLIEVRRIALEKAGQLKVSDEQAKLLADSIAERLASAADQHGALWLIRCQAVIHHIGLTPSRSLPIRTLDFSCSSRPF